jgi:hypothetical protein
MEQERKAVQQEEEYFIHPLKRALMHIEKLRMRLDVEGLRDFAFILQNVFQSYIPDEDLKIIDKEITRSVWFAHLKRRQIREQQKLNIGDRDWILVDGGKKN